jgi:hypothetical protein
MKDQNHAQGSQQFEPPSDLPEKIDPEIQNGRSPTQNPLERLAGIFVDLSRRFTSQHVSPHCAGRKPKQNWRKAKKRRRKIAKASRKRNRQ